MAPPPTPRRGPLGPLLIAYFAFITIGMPGGLLNIAWTYMQDTFNVTLGTLGILLTAGTIGHLTTSFVSGRLMTGFGIGPSLLGGSLLTAAGIFGYVFSPSWPLLLLSALLASMGAGLLDAGLNTFVSAHYSASRLNWLHAAFGLGATIGPLLVTFTVVTLAQSWRVSYALALLLAAVLSLSFLLTLKRWTLTPEVGSDPEPQGAGLWETFRLPMVLITVALFFVYGGVEVGTGQLTNSLFIDGHGIDQETAGVWISLYWASFTFGRILMGFVADRVPNLLLLRVAMLGAVVGAVLLWQHFTDLAAFLGLTLIGFSLAPIFPILVAETQGRVGLRHTANTIGFEIGFAGLGLALLPGLAGAMAERLGVEIIGPFLLVIALVMVALHEIIIRHKPQRAG